MTIELYDSALFELLATRGEELTYAEVADRFGDAPYAFTKGTIGLAPADERLVADDIRQDLAGAILRSGVPYRPKRRGTGAWRLGIASSREDGQRELKRLAGYATGSAAAAAGMERVLHGGDPVRIAADDLDARRALLYLHEQQRPVKAKTVEDELGFPDSQWREIISRLRTVNGVFVIAGQSGYRLVSLAGGRGKQRSEVERQIASLRSRDSEIEQRRTDFALGLNRWHPARGAPDRTRLSRLDEWRARHAKAENQRKQRREEDAADRAGEISDLKRWAQNQWQSLADDDELTAFCSSLNQTGSELDAAIEQLRKEEAATTLDTEGRRTIMLLRARDRREYEYLKTDGYLPKAWQRDGHWLDARHFRAVDAPEEKRAKRHEKRSRKAKRSQPKQRGTVMSAPQKQRAGRVLDLPF